jgi:molecular chaperone DnaK (HSP70)
MSEDTITYFGIDLGTTYSVVSYVDESGRPTVVRSVVTNDETTPSVVYFENAQNVVVGEAAKNVSKLYPQRVVERVKRSMGKDVQWEFDDQTYTPESISALILKQLAQDAADYSGREVRQVVITVPAYFGMLERDATRKAGQIAGLDVIGIVPEPVAAALQYDVTGGPDTRTVLVYDLGGGTFDTTVIRVTADSIDVLCTDGDQTLGGVDWDARLVSYLTDEFVARAEPEEDPTADEEFMQSLALTAEDLKRQLSRVETRQVPLRFGAASAVVDVSRATFEEITRDKLDRTIEITERTLGKLAEKLGVDDPARHIDEVLLVGGSSRMPAVARRLSEKFGWTPKLHDPDLAVAKGAARFALSRALWDWERTGEAAPTPEQMQDHVKAIALRTNVDEKVLAEMANRRITTVLPKAFGIKLQDTSDPDWRSLPEKLYIHHLVMADETLPSGKRQLNASTVQDNQRAVSVEIYEQAGETPSRELSANKPVDKGAGLISGIPPLPRSSPIDIQMEVDSEGLLVVEAHEPASGQQLRIEVRVSVLSDEEVEDAQKLVSSITVRS